MFNVHLLTRHRQPGDDETNRLLDEDHDETITNMNPGPKQRSYPLPSTPRDQNCAAVEQHGDNG